MNKALHAIVYLILALAGAALQLALAKPSSKA